MNEPVMLVLAGMAGIGLGLFYFVGLWWTVQRLPHSSSPARLMLGSMMVRLSVTVLGFYLVMGSRWQNVIACLVGFLIVRVILIRRQRARPVQSQPRRRETEVTEKETVRS